MADVCTSAYTGIRERNFYILSAWGLLLRIWLLVCITCALLGKPLSCLVPRYTEREMWWVWQTPLLPVFWLAGGHQRLEAQTAGAQASSGRNRRRQCIRHGRNMAGQHAVCRRSLRNGAFRRQPSQPASQRLCQPTLWCAVCLLLCRRRRLLRWLAWLTSCRQLWLRRERRAVRACAHWLRLPALAAVQTRSGAGRRFDAQFWTVCCACLRAGDVLGVRRG